MEIKELLKGISLSTLESLEEAYNRVTELLKNKGAEVYQPDILNETIAARYFSRIFNIYDKQNEKKYTFFVMTAPWDNEKVNKILNSFSQPGEKSQVHFLSAHPLPEILEFINKNTPASWFELEAIRNFKKTVSLSEEPEVLEYYAALFKTLAEKYFSAVFTGVPAQDLKEMERLLITYYRNNEPFEYYYEYSIEYYPAYSLTFFGLFLADMLVKNFNGTTIYPADQGIEKMGVGFSGQQDEHIDIVAHPLEKVNNFFYLGKDYSIINWYYEIKFFLNSAKK